MANFLVHLGFYSGFFYSTFVLLAEIVSKATAITFCGKAYFLRNVRKASLCLLYCFVRGTLSPSFTPCKGDNISQREPVPSVSYADISPHCGESPLTPEMPPSAVFYYFYMLLPCSE